MTLSSDIKSSLPPDLYARVLKFIELFKQEKVTDAQFLRVVDMIIKPALQVSLSDNDMKTTLQRGLQPLLGRKLWFKRKNGVPCIIEIVPSPDLVKLCISTDDEVKKNNLPGVTYDVQLLKEALDGKINPILAMMTGKIKITGLTDLIKMGSPLITALKPYGEREDLKAKVAERLVNDLDPVLQEYGC